MRIGVLSLQGAFAEHIKMIEKCGSEAFEIRQKSDIEKEFDGLILPGGESTVMIKLLKELSLFEPIKEKIKNGLPVMGTCAGLLLLSEKVNGYNGKTAFGTMRITAKRNAYGRQLGSFETKGFVEGIGEYPMVFIRAPYIEECHGAEILAEVDGRTVAARDKNQLAFAFHPELTENTAIHEYFLNLINK